MNTISAEFERKGGNMLVANAATACVIVCLIASPLAGLGVGMAVAAIGLAQRRRRPTAKEVAVMLAALAAAVVLAVLVDNWNEFKEGIVDGFNRFRRS